MTNITAVIIADSVSESGKRITTFELEYPRFIHSEMNTHRMISKNAASSRAIPVKAMLDNIKANPAIPTFWGKNQAGMSAKEECNNDVVLCDYLAGAWQSNEDREGAWHVALEQACLVAEAFDEAGYHKQIVNRLTEPFQMIKVVATATEWDNFFWLRNHADAQPEIKVLAEKMLQALAESEPVTLTPEDWHMPYFGGGYWLKDCGIPLEDALAISSSCCAQVSYRKTDDSLEKAKMVYERLVGSEPVHASPFEHQSKVMLYNTAEEAYYAGLNKGTQEAMEWERGVTSNHRTLGLMSGNFAGWIQHRQLINNNTCWRLSQDIGETQ